MRVRHHIRRILPLLLVCLFAAGPSSAGDPTAIPAKTGKVRVASLVPFVGPALDQLPSGRAELVAIVRRSPTAKVEDVMDLGSPHGPSLEMLVASRPDLIVADETMHLPMTDRLQEIAPVLMMDTASVNGTFESLKGLGREVGAEKEMNALVDAANTQLDELRLKQPHPTLPLFGTPSRLLVMTDRTWFGDLLERIDLENLAGPLTGQERVPGYVLVSDEVLATMHPELIVVVAHGDPKAIEASLKEKTQDGGAWSSLAKGARIHLIDAHELSGNPGLDMPKVARSLRAFAVEP